MTQHVLHSLTHTHTQQEIKATTHIPVVSHLHSPALSNTKKTHVNQSFAYINK